MGAKISTSLYEVIGKKIQQHRERMDFSQEQLARNMDPPLTRSAISNMERGRQNLNIHTLYSIAQILKIKIYELLPDDTSDPLKTAIEQQLQTQNIPKKTGDKIWKTLRSE